MADICFVGLGLMGTAMAERLVAAGHRLIIPPRRPEHAVWAHERGVTVAASLEEAVADADFVILCVYSDVQVRASLLDDPAAVAAMRPGCTVILHTTGSPGTARDVAQVAARRGSAVVDSPVRGGRGDIAAGRIALFVGGDAAAVSHSLPVLSAYADPVLHVGPVGAGQATKLANNLLFAAQVRLMRDATRLLEDFGCDLDASLAAIAHGSGDSRVLGMVRASGGIAAFAASAARFIDKDVGTCAAVAGVIGADMGLLGEVAMAAQSA